MMSALRTTLSALVCLSAAGPALAFTSSGGVRLSGYIGAWYGGDLVELAEPSEQRSYNWLPGPHTLTEEITAGISRAGAVMNGQVDVQRSPNGLVDMTIDTTLSLRSTPPPDERHTASLSYGGSVSSELRVAVLHESHWQQLSQAQKDSFKQFELAYVLPDSYSGQYVFDFSATVNHVPPAPAQTHTTETTARAILSGAATFEEQSWSSLPAGDSLLSFSGTAAADMVTWFSLSLNLSSQFDGRMSNGFTRHQSLGISDSEIELWTTNAQGQTVSVHSVGRLVSGVVPEPTSIVLTVAGLLPLLWWTRRAGRRATPRG